MSKEMQELKEMLERSIHEVTTSKKAAREFLMQLGVLTQKGKLRKKFKLNDPVFESGSPIHSSRG